MAICRLGSQVQNDVHHAGLGFRFGEQPRAAEHFSHPVVLAKRVRHEPGDAFRPRSMHELFEQVAADPMTLPAIRDDERDLCVVSAWQAVEAANGNAATGPTVT